ncbi:nucleotidyl transferase AbiEii/AbiGii toxin family protein [Patescibacteria group bacterium]|nr:nucleotidyl transferase AbiEii/AbiGii toxin family protein [Patescibacteria group bacterium]
MNNNTFPIHPDLLDKRRQEVLLQLIPFTKGFVLGGGTALALQLSHRKSFDFDFFSLSEIQKQLLEKLSNSFIIDNITIDTSDELTFFTQDSIKITFLYYPFNPLFENIKVENGLQIFTIKDIALQKAYAIGRRGVYRDYFDLYTILKNGHMSLKEIILGSKQVFNGAFDEKIFLEQLVYFKDILNFEIIPIGNKTIPTLDEIKNYFEELTKKYINITQV